MLEYEWSNLMNSSSIMLPVDEMAQQVDPQQTRPVYNPETHFTLTTNFTDQPANFFNPETHYHHHHQTQLHFHHHPISNTTHFTNLYDDPRAYSSYHHAPPSGSMLVEPGPDQTGFMVVPKPEPVVDQFNSRIGLNLGGRTYFASSEDDFVNRLYRRSRLLEPGSMNTPRCQAEGCNADLSQSKHYHRRHKVCEYHSKASTVVAGGLTQRFCQQCSRFHVLSEFDNGKRSCRRRLADHNRRRRKSSQKSNSRENNNNKEDIINAPKSSSSENLPRSPPDSSGPHSSSVTAAVSSPRISLDCLGYRPYNVAATSSSTASTTSLFYANE